MGFDVHALLLDCAGQAELGLTSLSRGVGAAVRRDDRQREGLGGHDASTGTSSAAVRTPAHRRREDRDVIVGRAPMQSLERRRQCSRRREQQPRPGELVR